MSSANKIQELLLYYLPKVSEVWVFSSRPVRIKQPPHTRTEPWASSDSLATQHPGVVLSPHKV